MRVVLCKNENDNFPHACDSLASQFPGQSPMKSTASSLALSCLLATACSDTSSSSPCEEVDELITTCYGEEAASEFVCDPDTAEEIADLTCAELNDIETKSDASLCSTLGFFCPADPIFPNPSGDATNYPIVLAHGFNGSPDNDWGVNPIIIDALEDDGHQVYIARVSPFKSVSIRGEELAAEIDRALVQFGAEKVNIIAHSMGGLDSRFAISSLGYDDRVASLVTISTPHRGSYVADAALGLIPGLLDDAVDFVVEFYAGFITSEELANDSDLRAAFASLAESNAAQFSEENPDAAGVYYQSWAGLSNVGRIALDSDIAPCIADGGEMHLSDGERDFMDLRLVLGAAIVAHGTALRANDGMATVESARWGDFKGCIPADHYDEIGQVGDVGPQRATGFDAAAFFRTIAFDLAQRGY